MNTKRIALSIGVLFVLLFTACGGGAATEAPSQHGRDYIPEEPAATEAPATEAPYSPDTGVQPYSPTYVAPSSNIPQSNREPYDMFFQDYGVNPLIDTEDDHLSTFALDVDTGSYTIMRNYLHDGNVPPSDSV